MTPEQQQIAIAQTCRWTAIKQGTNRHPCFQQEIDYGPTGIRPDQQAECYLPDYLNDLNAIHEAEKILSNSQIWQMDSVLFNMADCVAPFRATASQRAEAFLRTLNLWTP